MKLDCVLRLAIGPGLFLLPPAMTSPQAQAMLLAIGLQESRFEHREQIGGPARGFWQFERGGGVRGVLNHSGVGHLARTAAQRLSLPLDVDGIYSSIALNDAMAAVLARLLLFTVPDRLPGRDDAELAWDQYLSAWRPGKPHISTWTAFYKQAWERVA